MFVRSNLIEVGRGPIENYVLNAIVLFNQGYDEICVKGRGELISKAVDTVNALIDRLGDTIKTHKIHIGTEKRGRKILSFIEIWIKRTI